MSAIKESESDKTAKMRLRLQDIEPFNPPTVANDVAGAFLKSFNGREEFDFDGDKKPMSMMITSVNMDDPCHVVAEGLLISISIDEYESNLGRLSPGTYVIDQYVLGEVKLEIMGDLEDMLFGGNLVKGITARRRAWAGLGCRKS